MASEGSQAPKERVNIVYKSDINGVQEDIELPFRMMVIGDFTLKADSTPLESREAIDIDKDNFASVMKAQKLGLDLSVKDRLSGKEEKDADDVTVNLKFESLADFGPASVARQVPKLRDMLEIREAIAALRGPLGNMADFRKKIEEILSDPAEREKLIAELAAHQAPESTN